ncbi:MAG: sugar phosphate isomerase/epimerase [Pseudomonadota bacterium]
MQIGVFAKTFPGSNPDHVFEQCSRAGFTCVQYNMACSGLGSLPTIISADAIAEVQRAGRKHSITGVAISATYNMADPDAARRQVGREAFATIARHAAEMGTNLLTVCSGSLDGENQWRHHRDNALPKSWDDMCREFETLLGIAEQHDVLIGVEPEAANIVNSSAKAADLLETFRSDRLRIVFDPANLLENVPTAHHRKTLDEAFDLLGPYIALAHAKDRFSDGGVAPAGKGVVDWDYVLGGLARIGFSGPLVAHGMTAKEAPEVAEFLTQCVARI